MLVKPRSPSEEIVFLRILSYRDDHFTNIDKFRLDVLEKGFAGELQFDEWLKLIPNTWLILNDPILKHDGKEIQIDTMLIGSSTIYLINVKNYERNYYVEDNLFYSEKTKKPKDL